MNDNNKLTTKTDIHKATSETQDKTSGPATKTDISDKTQMKAVANQSKSAPPEIKLNQVIQKRYKIEALLGHGGMCDVYRAKDLLLEAAGDSQPYVAIKLLQKEFNNQPDAGRILLREARKTQKLSHPNIIKVHSFGSSKDSFYLIMEWLDGQTLDEVIKSHRPHGLSFTKSMSILRQLISALRYAHENGVVHADLKPGNIMLTRDGDLKVFDFGVSRALNTNIDKYSTEAPDATSPVSGYTPTYASPELLAGGAPDKADDIYAFSCIAYELLSSKHPYQRKTAAQAVKENLTPAKPRNIPLVRWKSLKNGLLLDSKKRTESITKLEAGLTRSCSKTAISAVILVCAIVVVGFVFSHQGQQLQTFQEVQFAHEQSEALLSLSPAQFLPQLQTFTEGQQTTKQAWLREQQPQVIDFYEEQIDELLNQRKGTYPNYTAMEAVLEQANAIYPDSYRLAVITEEINQGWSSTIKVLSQRLDAFLDQGKYQTDKDGDDIFTIYSNLTQVRPDYRPAPSSKAEMIFATRFDQAATKLDTQALVGLIAIGETFFADCEQQQSRLDLASNLKGAVQIMAEYRASKQEDAEAAFPYKAAEHIYQKRFESIATKIGSAGEVQILDKLEREVAGLAKELPNDFSALVEVRQSMANKYLRFSDSLLKKNWTKSANAVMKKAQDLLTLVQQARTANNS